MKYVDKPLIKVLSGLRRSGKSSVLALLQNHLLSTEIEAAQIVSINFESMKFSEIYNAGGLYEAVSSKINWSKTTYIFLDEIQEVTEWE